MSEAPPYRIQIVCWAHGVRQAKIADSLSSAAGSALQWTHVESIEHGATATLLSKEFGFHELEIEDALMPGERPHLHESEDHLFFTVPAVRIDGEKLYFAEVAFFLSKGRLVTVSTEPVALLDQWQERCQAKSFGPIHEGSRLVYFLVDAIIDAYYPAMDLLEDRAELLEDTVFKGDTVAVKDLLRLKRRLLETRRRLTPFRDILNGLLRHDLNLIAKADRAYFQDVYDHVLRVLEHVDLSRDILASVLDANLATVSNRLNQIMRVLTVASVLLMSAALIAGIYGMNFKFMPEIEWPWGYPLALISMVLVVLVELWVFRKRRWL